MSVYKDKYFNRHTEQGQNLYDLAIQEYGSVAEIFLLLSENPNLDINEKITPNTSFQVAKKLPNNIFNAELAEVFRESNIIINTGDDIKSANYLLQENLERISQETNFGILIN